MISFTSRKIDQMNLEMNKIEAAKSLKQLRQNYSSAYLPASAGR
jgi:hypothetical protein